MNDTHNRKDLIENDFLERLGRDWIIKKIKFILV